MPAEGPIALIRLGYACNNNCVFCHSSERRGSGLELDTDRVREKIKKAAGRGAGSVVFSGGEPTIRKDILELMRYARSQRLGRGLITNGRMFCYSAFAEQVEEIGLDYALVSIHGPDGQMHDALAGSASFEQSIAGLAAVSKLASRVVVNTVLTRQNASGLAKTARLLERFAPLHYKVSLPEPKGAILEQFDVVLPPHDAARAVENFLAEYKPGRGVTVGIDGLPPCLLHEYYSLNDDFFTHGFYLVSEPGEDDFYPATRGERVFSRNCIFCSMYHLCPGIYVKYFEKFHGDCLKPLKREVSNTVRFDFEKEEPADKSGRSECEIIKYSDPARRLAVRKGNRLELYLTKEIQTDVPELMRLKLDIEQVYVTKSEIEKHGRRPGHLMKLQLAEKCRNCLKLRLCPGVYIKPPKQPFSLLEKRYDDLLGMLKGRVFEIGCGSEPYARTIKRMIRAGSISSYLGMDPGLAQKTKTGMEGSYILMKGLFEELKWTGPKFDFVVMFRSYNHLADLRRAGSVLSAITAKGSKLIITEDHRLIELKKSVLETGGKPGRGFDHIRNHTARGAADVLKGFGFEPEILWEPDRFSAGCWAISAERKE